MRISSVASAPSDSAAAIEASRARTERQMAILLEAAPHALAMIERLRQPRERGALSSAG